MDISHPNNPPNWLPKSNYKATKHDPDFKHPLEPSCIPDGLSSDTICKYPGTFSTVVALTSTVQKTVSIEHMKKLLYFKHLPDIKVNNSVVVPQEKPRSKPRVSAKGKVTKPTAPKRAKKTAATTPAMKKILEELEEGAPVSALATVMATKATAPKRATKTAAAAAAAAAATKSSEVEETAPVPPLTLSAAMASEDTAPKSATVEATPPRAFLAPTASTGAAGLGGEIVARAPVRAFDCAKPCLLHLADNGVQRVRISGATSEETEKNSELQAMGRLGGCNKLVFFDVKDGEIRGVRVDGEMYVRVTEVVID
ncbi:hypothetical protein HBI38_127380 [Parastagonospora nodorum]|nr:hypothetical protein HBI10_147110 [Parastagonospora nodorum]KAH4019968.1 hypothetical protein HBI13_120260 [Parastagonospora nodorum]KAH4937215.1 hypothetical protein HBH74_078800 [Parastagonospora nodorum]KAH4948476.1 hypothetical protein HBH73_124870 [Parastagonospora nodorum]KAH5184465.1 hypothetical protein HBH76_137200 [Parastagonospora nodorum]